jgi:hypothetical protein
MPRENSQATVEHIIEQVEKARAILDEVLALASRGVQGNPRKQKPASGKVAADHKAIDFSTPMRAFVKKHSNGMNGPKKFALLVAYLTKGEVSKQVSLVEVVKQWNKMTGKGLLGMKFNPVYTVRARESDWVHAEKAGMYKIRPAWKEIF